MDCEYPRNRRNRGALACSVMLIGVTACRHDKPVPALRPPVAVVQDFEHDLSVKRWPREGAGTVALSNAWSADGQRSLELGPGLMASFKDLGVTDWRGYTTLRFTVHNLATRTAGLGFELQDEHDSFHERYQQSFGATPGDQVISLDISGGLRRGEENRPHRGEVKTPLNLGSITRLAFANRGTASLFIDRIELLNVSPLTTLGGFAFDLGRADQQVMGQTIGIFPTTLYTPERGYGLLAPVKDVPSPLSYPTPLLGDGLPLGEGFRVDLPGGPYLGWIAFERGGFTEGEQPQYTRAEVLMNDAVVTGHSFARGAPHFLFEDTELTELSQIESRLVWPAHAIARFRFEAVRGGNLIKLAVTGSTKQNPLRVAGVILAPDTPDGRAFLEAHEQRQRDAIALAYPHEDRARRDGGRAPPAQDLVAEPLAVGAPLYPGDFPEHPQGAMPAERAAFVGHVTALGFALYAPRALDVHIEVRPLLGTHMSIPSPRISYGCYLPMRSLENGPVWLEVNHYRPEPDVHVGPGLARAVLLEWNLPADREPGLYLGEVVFRAGSVESRVPLRIRVHAVALPPVPIPVGLFLSALPFGSDTMDIERWWALQTELLDEQARAGLNCLTGGPGLLFRSRRSDGELVLRGGDALRYLELARARGISRAAVNYGSFFPSLRVDRVGASAFARAWQTLVDAHAIPPFYFSSYDEPGTPAETQAALEQVAPLTAAGLRTMGFLSHARDDGLGERLIAATYAPALAVHTPEDLRALKAQGRHPWVYNNGIDRYAMGLHLWRNLHAGAEGRLEWIGLITQGFAFNQLDGRESATAAWMVHDRLGLLPTPRWLSAREGLLDLRVRLALERAVPAGDPVLAAWSSQGYGQDRPRWSDAALEAERGAMLERLSRGP